MKTLFLFLLFFAGASCRAQQIVKISDELKALESNQEKYVGKPLAYFLSNVKFPIKYVIGAPGEGVRRSAFIFSFVPFTEREKYRKKGKFPPTLIVYVTGDFEWNRVHLQRYKRNEWTKDDASKYGHLTVYKIAVLYENETLE